jgi:hypothetical protein
MKPSELKLLAGFVVLSAILAYGINAFVERELLPNPNLNPEAEKGIYLEDERGFFDRFKEGPKSLLNGLPLAEGAVDYPIAVMIENFSTIRDRQQGLEKAAIVIESLTEGGITRFLAIFNGEPVEVIGPVRSARPYFVDWAEELQTAYVHIGGSNAALQQIRASDKILNVQEFSDHNIIWRHPKYEAPHNAFTSIDGITAYMKEQNYWRPLEESRFEFDEDSAQGTSASVLTIGFSPDKAYDVRYTFDPSDGLYARLNDGKPQGQIKPANILVQYTKQEVLDSEGRLAIQTLGTGKALIFTGGKMQEGLWEKNEGGVTQFLDAKGEKVKLKPGQTWIEVVPETALINYF